MGKLVFRVASDWQEVVKLRTEIEKLKQMLLSMDSTQSPDTFKKLNEQLGESTKKMNILISDAAKVGATMENDFKKGIYDGEKAINSLSEEIIKQKNIIRETQNDVSMLTEQYKKLGKYDPKRQSLSDELNRAKAALGEQKYALGELQSQQTLARLSTKALKDEYALFKDESKAVITVNEGVGVSFKKTLAAIGGIAMLKQVASNVVSTAGMFQKYESVLTNALNGSSDKAKAYLSDINSFAAKTNFQLNELTDDFIKFVNRGVTPSMDAMKKMGDFTNTVAKPFNQLTEAILDINNPERWKEFGVRVQTEGNKVKLSFRDMTVECDRTVESVMKAVEQFGSMRGVEGSTEAISKTIEGQMSNLEDTITTALAEIGLANQDLISGSISAADTIVKNYEVIGQSALTLVSIYGVYRTGLLVNSLIEQGFTKAIWGKIAATKAATLAQATYNKVLLMNPYVMAGVAVVSLGIAMWTLADNTSEAEKAQKRFNEKQKEALKQEEEHKQKIDSLVDSSRDIALADLQRGQSLAELRKEYPKIFAQYDIETIKLADILKLKQQIAEEDAKRAGEKRAKELSDIESEIKYYENLLKSLSGQQGVDGYVKKLKELRTERDVMLQEKGKGISEQFISSLKDVDISEFDRYISELEKRIKGKGENGTVKLRLPIDVQGSLSDEAIYGVKDIKTLIDTVKTTKQTRIDSEKNKTTYKQDYQKAKKDWEEAKKKLSEIEKDKFKFTSKQYEEAKKREETAEKAYKNLGGSVSSNTKQENQADKLRKEQDKYKLLLDKQALDKKRSAEDLQMQVDETRIKAMQDGSKKTIAQMELDNKKEIQQLERQKEDYIRNAIQAEREKFEANPSNKGKSFNPSTVSVDASSFDSIITNTKVRQKNDEIKEHQQAWENYLIEYGSFLQKKEALTVQYNAKINEASTQGQKESLKKELSTKLKELNFNELKDSLNFADVFGDLDSQTTTALTSLRDKLKEYINKAAKDLKPEDLKELQDAFKNIDFKIAERNPFEELKNGLEEYKDSCKEIEKAQNVLNATQQFGFTTVQQYDKETGKVTYSLITQKQAEKDLANAQSDRQKSLSKLTQSANSIGSKGMEVVNAGNQLVDMLGNLGVEIPEAVRETLDGVGQIMSGLERIDLTKPFSAVTGMIGVLSGVGNTIAGLLGFGNKANELTEEQIREYESLSDAMDKCIDRHKALMDELTNEEAVTEYEKTIELTKRKIEATKKIGEDYMNSNAKRSHTYGYKMRKDIEPYRAELAAIGIDLDSLGGRLENIFSLPVDKLKLLQETSAWGVLDKQTQEYIQTLIDADEKVKELGDDLNENLTQTSFDSVFNNFLDMLTDMDSSSEDFAENFEEYMRNAILRSMLVKNYQGRIEEWYKKFSAANKDGIDDKEYEELKQEWNGIVSDAKRDTDALKDDFGWGSSSSQSSTRKSYETVSQDSIEETNGRLTAVQIAGEEIKNQNINQSESLNLLTMKADAILSVNTEIRNIADETRDLMASSYLELVQISENTGAIVKPIQQIQKDIAEVKKNTAKL